jgi:hypothetical protein
MGEGFRIDTSAMQALGQGIDAKGRQMAAQAPVVQIHPDAGRSSPEAAAALVALAATVAALAGGVGDVVQNVEACVARYRNVDGSLADHYRQIRGQ